MYLSHSINEGVSSHLIPLESVVSLDHHFLFVNHIYLLLPMTPWGIIFVHSDRQIMPVAFLSPLLCNELGMEAINVVEVFRCENRVRCVQMRYADRPEIAIA